MNERIRGLEAYMEREGLDAAVVTLPKHVYYLTGYLSDPHERFLGVALRRGEEPFLLVPELDAEAAQAASAVKTIYTHSDTGNPFEVLREALGTAAQGRIGIEKSSMTVERYERLTEALKAKSFAAVDDALRDMRAVKSADEIARMKHAVRLIEDVLRDTLPLVKPGVTEIELAAEIDYRMKKLGADGPSFPTTVLAGEKSALPHGSPGRRKIAAGELLLFDMGVYADGYASDITRTFAVEDISDTLKTVYHAVLEANRRGIGAVRAGVRIAEADRSARRVIEDAGYGAYFTHRLGHGLGLDVHEYPSVHGANEELLREGMAVTIEPGIYLPGAGGVRIEDDVIVTRDGAEVLTSFPRELTVIGG
ncbi:M24 family metallopeptidase [Paenibacillus humicola]|uniref:M24 family metallopeptidase n=1 Tax=Paenibacillus humicola TaxID=3110540 RepID=UPI00237B0878|nr:Xaa-Pro peptidase family protein [Paenibacillus humicola]